MKTIRKLCFFARLKLASFCKGGNENNKIIMQIMKVALNFCSGFELLNMLCNFCELFLLIFILAYAFFESLWLLPLIIAGIIGILYNLQDRIVYHPQEPSESKFYIENPSMYNMLYENVNLVTSDSVNIHSYLLKQPDNLFHIAPTIIHFHGNAGNIGHRLSNANFFVQYCQCNVLLVEYRGYGLSEGIESEKGFYKDGEAAVNYLLSRTDIDTSKIIVFGQSIGGAVVIDLALKFNEKLFAVIVENTFTSMPEIGRELFSWIPGISLLPDVCFKNKYKSIDKLKFVTMPGLFISGQADTMIPPKMMNQLFDKAACGHKRLLKLADGNHNNTWLCPGYFQFVSKFIQEIYAIKNSNLQNKPASSQVWVINSS